MVAPVRGSVEGGAWYEGVFVLSTGSAADWDDGCVDAIFGGGSEGSRYADQTKSEAAFSRGKQSLKIRS